MRGGVGGRRVSKPIDCLKVCAEWVRRYQAGETPRQIADGTAYGAQMVTLHLARHGALEVKSLRSAHACDERCEDMAQGYAAGDSLEAIGLRYRITRERVRQLLRSHKVPIRLPSTNGRARHVCNRVCERLIADTAASGFPNLAAIARDFGVTAGGVSQRALRHGIKGRRGMRHECGANCHRLMAYMIEHPEVTTFTAASKLGIHPSWVGSRFKALHPEYNRTRKHFIENGRRIAESLAAQDAP